MTCLLYVIYEYGRQGPARHTFFQQKTAFGMDIHISLTFIFFRLRVNEVISKFKSESYVGEISENAQKNTPVTLLGPNMIPEVYDHDQGTNGTFKLFP